MWVCSEESFWWEILYSDISLVSYNIWLTLIVSRHLFYRAPKKLSECSSILFWQNIMEPFMSNHNKIFLFLVAKQVWVSKGWSQQFMAAHKLVPLTLALMYTCPLGKNPIFPQEKNQQIELFSVLHRRAEQQRSLASILQRRFERPQQQRRRRRQLSTDVVEAVEWHRQALHVRWRRRRDRSRSPDPE